MENNENRLIDMDIADAIIERYHTFELNGVRYRLYPPTLGHKVIIDRLMDTLGFDLSRPNPTMEVFRVCCEHKATVAKIIAVHTSNVKEDILDSDMMERKARMIEKGMDTEEISSVLILLMTMYNTETFIRRLGLDEEHERLFRVQKCKKNRNSFSFNGRSMYGTLIDYACERYGWTMDYVVWGISYQNLQMLSADAIVHIYLDDEEMKQCHVPNGKEKVINGDDPANAEYLKELLKNS